MKAVGNIRNQSLSTNTSEQDEKEAERHSEDDVEIVEVPVTGRVGEMAVKIDTTVNVSSSK